jgi:hypothetical protein
MVLRDTKVRTAGRTYLDPRAIIDRATGYLCTEETPVHLYGYTFGVRAFPWMQQDGNVIRCAHVALWGIIRYFSDKYSYYAESSLHRISEMVESEQRKNPSAGMTIEQIAQVFRDNRFFPGLYFRGAMSNGAFDRLLYVMIESGMPYVAALTGSPGEGHAFAVVGHGPVASATARLRGRRGIVDTSELVDYLIASDDNYIPYTKVERNRGAVLNSNGHVYAFGDISAAVVPFYEKMHLDISGIFGGMTYQGCLGLIENNYFDLPQESAIVRRVLLTSSKSYKAFMVEQGADEALRMAVLLLEMPKFIWLAEYSLADEYEKGEVGWYTILDATAMNYQQDVFLALRCRDRFIVNRAALAPGTETPLVQYVLATHTGTRYTNNLQEVL